MRRGAWWRPPAAAALALAAAAALAMPPGVGADTRPPPEAASGLTARPAVAAPRAMVVTANPHATETALAVLRDGGSAADAAIAAALVLNVVEPQSSGIGGGGFLLHFDARQARLRAYDGRETAPAATAETLFLKPDGTPMAFFDAVVGGRAVGAPGLLRLLESVHRAHGRLPWQRLLAPAIRLAEEGFAVSPRLNALLRAERFLAADAQARRLFFDAKGRPLAVGARLRNPALAAVLRRVAAEGADAFYRGAIARDIVAAVRAGPNPGSLSLADLAAYRAIEREPLCGRYRRWRVCGMPPPSSGGGTVLALLGVLERFRLGELAPDSAFAVHLFAEAGRLAYADRDAWYGDPAAMRLRPAQLLDPVYLAHRATSVRLAASQGRAEAGAPPGVSLPPVKAKSPELMSTSHLSVVDADGNAVALTVSIESAFGSRRMVDGFLLNNQLTDFSFAPVDARGRHPNRPGPGKRPRSSMAPTVVFDDTGRLYAVLGSPGGSAIINYVAETLVRLLDWQMAPDAALGRPHAGSRNGPVEVEDTAGGRELAARMILFGETPRLGAQTSGLAVIVRRAQEWIGAADPRREGAAAGF